MKRFYLDFTIAFSDHREARVLLSKLPMRTIAVDLANIVRSEAPSGRLKSPGETRQFAPLMIRFLRDAVANGLPPTANLRDLRPAHVDGFEARLRQTPNKQKSIHGAMMMLRKFLEMADDRGLLDASMRPRLAFSTLRKPGRSTPRDAYSDYVHAQIRKGAEAEALAVGDAVAEGLEYPSSEHAFPFIVLLCLDPGLPVECVKELRTGCLRRSGGLYADLRYVKRRARESDQTIRVKDGVPLSPGWLVSTFEAATRSMREHVRSKEDSFLFLIWSDVSRLGVRLEATRLDLANDGFCKRNAIVDDSGLPIERLQLSRLRKTAKDHRYRDVLGSLKVFANDHTPGVAARHYASITNLLPLHEATIEAGLRDAMLTRSSVIDGLENPAVLSDDEVERDANDVFTANCRDIGDSPYGASATGSCKVPVWGCLDCRNARIGRAHLPGILAFLNFLAEKRQQMNGDAWARTMGRAYTLIKRDILPGFAPEVVEWARGVAESNDEVKWLRAELQTLVS